MATVTTSVQGGGETGTTHTVSGLTYLSGDLLIAFTVTTDSSSLTVNDGGTNSWSLTEIGGGGRLYTRLATNNATNTSFTVTRGSSGAVSFISFIVRPDAGKVVSISSSTSTTGTGTSVSLAVPGTITTSSVLFGAHMVNNDVYFTDTDTTNGAWSAVNVETSSGVDRAVASQWKIPNAVGAQTYNGTFAGSETWRAITLNVLEADLGFWGVRA